MLKAGLDYSGPLHADGRLHRMAASGDRKANSWYVIHVGPPTAGAFGCWKRGIKQTWWERNGELSQSEWDRIRERWHQADAERELTEKQRHTKARTIARWIISRSKPANTKHPYLVRKGVSIHGDLRQRGDLLVLPLKDIRGQLNSLQFIAPDQRFGDDGEKRDKSFLSGGRIAGTFFTLADKPDGPLVIAEGYSTAASISEATGFAAVCAMNCGNLLAVAKALRARHPDREIIIAADNDQWTQGNPGLCKATEAAKAISARLVVTQFANIWTQPTDFNDLHNLEGLNTVNKQLKSAKTIARSDPTPHQHPIHVPPPYTPPPLSLVPYALREYVEAAAESVGVDVAFVFLPILSALAAAIGNSRNLRVKKGFVQPPILWTTIVARSGSKKSPALSTASKFICDRERELLRQNETAGVRFDKLHREWDAAPKKDRGEEPKTPPRQTCLVDDLTLAVIAPILRDNPRGVLVVKDELAGLFGSFGQFSQSRGGASADLSGWLSLFNGERLLLDRKTNRESHRIFNPRLSIAGCIPPSVLSGALTADFFHRGLPARILFAAPPPRPSLWTDAEVPCELEDAVTAIFSDLFSLEGEQLNDGPKPVDIALDAEGLEVFKAFYDRVGQHAVESSEKEEAAWSKLTGGAARLAVVGHLAHGFDIVPVGAQVMEAAVELASWFGHEAERIYASFHEPPEVAVSRRLLEFIQRQGGSVSVRDIADKFRPLKNQTEEIEKRLNHFQTSRLGEWQPITVTERGGRPTRKFRLFSAITSCECPGNLEVSEENRGFPDTDSLDTNKTTLDPNQVLDIAKQPTQNESTNSGGSSDVELEDLVFP